MPSTEARHKGVRWWPALLIVTLFLAYLVRTWYFSDAERQFKIRGIVMVGSVLGGGLLVWLFFLSRIRLRIRMMIMGGLVAIAVFASFTLRVRGVTGDRIPILEWRWNKSPQPMAMVHRTTTATTDEKRSSQVGREFRQFQGPDRNGTVDTAIVPDWTAHPPVLLWHKAIGAGWSGFAVADGKAVTLEQAGELEQVSCFDLETGAKLWAHSYPARFEESSAGVGPRTVPTIWEGRVYTCGATGILSCIDLASGKSLWAHNLFKSHNAPPPNWGYSISPVVADGKLVVLPGGPNGHSAAAYDPITGDLLWTSGDNKVSYSSPVVAEIAGVRQVLAFDAISACGYDLKTGKLLWSRSIPPAAHVATPVPILPDRVLVSSGYGIGSYLLQIEPDESGTTIAKLLWKSIRLRSKFGNIIIRDDHAYGLDDGRLACIDLADGKLKWKASRYGHGQLLLVGRHLFVLAENGDAVLLDISPSGANELTRFKALSGKTWNPPSIFGEYLLVRNDQEAACFRLQTEPKK